MGIKRQYVYWVNLDPTKGKEIKKKRPCLVISSDIYNNNSGLVTILPITDIDTKIYTNQVAVYKKDGCVEKDSKIKVDQIRTVSTERIGNEIGKLPDEKYKTVKQIIIKIFDL